MPEVIFAGPAGRLEGRYQPSSEKSAPIAIVLHPHPQFGGTMNNKIVYDLFYMFQKRSFTTLRFNFRGIGRSQGEFDHGTGELSDAAAALDWIQSLHPDSKTCWVAGYSFSAWIGMQMITLAAAKPRKISRQPIRPCSHEVRGQKMVDAKPAISVRCVMRRRALWPVVCTSAANAAS